MTVKRYLCFLMALCLLFFLFGCQKQESEGLWVEVLDVGQSDCTLLTAGDAVLMIDAGTATEREAVLGGLRERGIEKLDYLLLTHPHEDHIGNARMLLETNTVKALILPPAASEDLGYTLVTASATAHNIPCHIAVAGDRYVVGDMTVEILFADGAPKEVNDGSVIFRVLYGDSVLLFTGDAEAAAETAALAAVPTETLDCDFLKAGHHGSSTSLGDAWLQAATPAHVAISCGADNDYGFPHAELLERLTEAGAEWHRTDTEGTLCYHSDGQTVTYRKKGG